MGSALEELSLKVALTGKLKEILPTLNRDPTVTELTALACIDLDADA